MDHPNVKYFIRVLKINDPLSVTKKDIRDLTTLKEIILFCPCFSDPVTMKAIFLTAFFGFFRISNIVPHSIASFDSARHFTGGDIFFQKNYVKLLLM